MSTQTDQTLPNPQVVDANPGLRAMLGRINRRVLIFVAVFAVLAILFQLQSKGVFLSPRNLSIMLRQSAILAVLASGVAILIIMSELDLAMGSAVFLCGTLAAVLSTHHSVPTPLILIMVAGLGVLMGLVNGLSVVVVGIPSFIATLAGLLAFRGIGLLWTDAATVGPVSPEFVGLTEGFIPPAPSLVLIGVIAVAGVGFVIVRNARVQQRILSHGDAAAAGRTPSMRMIAQIAAVVVPLGVLAWAVGNFLGIPLALVWVTVIVITLSTLMGRTTFGRNAYLIGANREAAEYAGINVKRTIFLGFVIMGVLYGVAGIMLTARLGSSTPGAGEFMELDAIAAAVIGGVALRGGKGTVMGAVMGTLLLTVINNGMSILNISSFSQQVIKAVILLAALGLDAFVERRSAS